MDVHRPFFQNVATVLIGVLFLNPIVAAAAELSIDAAGGGNTSLGQAANGVTIVNIATANANGLSHNKFSDYNVGAQGLILNNATGQTQSTQLGGIILGNSNLNGRAAGLILNEVTGGNASQLRGYTEVAGQGAHVIVANPHGITCDGCGFINTPHATLTTGKPVVDNGRLDRLDVNDGAINIEGSGLNASNIDQFDLITRSAKINAELYAKQLNVITGRNEVKLADLSATAKVSDGSTKPQLAIDSSALGGMYAGAIRLVGTEAGVGVKLAGAVAASAGDMQIDANGHLSLAQTSARDNLKINAASVALNGNTYAGGSVDITARDQLSNSQGLAARDAISLKAGQVSNTGVIEAGVNADSTRNAAGDMRVNAVNLRNSGTLNASRQLDVRVAQALDNHGGRLLTLGDLSISANSLNNAGLGLVFGKNNLVLHLDSLSNQNGEISSQGRVAVDAATLDNQSGKLIGERELQVTTTHLDNRQGVLSSKQQLTVTSTTLDNRDQGALSSKGAAQVTVGQIDNRNAGLITAGGALSIKADALDSSQLGEVSAGGDLDLQLGQLIQQQGRLIGDAALNLDLRNGVLDNRGGLINAHGPLQLSHVGDLDNRDEGEISSDAGIRIFANSLDNSNRGSVIATGALSLTAQTINNADYGLLSGWQGVSVIGDSLSNVDQGTLSSKYGSLSLQLTGDLNNSNGGALVSKGLLSIGAENLYSEVDSILSSDADLELNIVDELTNEYGLISSLGDMRLNVGSLDNYGGEISSGRGLWLSADVLRNTRGKLSSTEAMTLALAGQLNNAQGAQIVSGGPMAVSAQTLNNNGGQLVSQSLLQVTAGDLFNGGEGTLAAHDALTIDVQGLLDNTEDGLIYSQQDRLTIHAAQIDNTGGTLSSKGDLHVVSNEELLSQQGRLQSTAGNVEVQASSLDNGHGGLLSSLVGWIKLTVSGLFDNHGGIAQGTSLTVDAGDVRNVNGHLSAVTGDTVIHAGDINNQDGGIYAHNRLLVTGDNFFNAGPDSTVSAESIDFTLRGELDNSQALIESGTTLRLDTGSLINRDGRLRALGLASETVIKTGSLDNQMGLLEIGNDDLRLDLGSLQNEEGSIEHVGSGNFGLASDLVMSASGQIITNGHLTITAPVWENTGVLQAGWLELNIDQFSQDTNGQLLATRSLTGTGTNWINNGLLASNGTLQLSLSGDYSGFGRLSSLGDLTISAANLEVGEAATIESGANATLTSRNQMTNFGHITAAGNLALNSAEFINYITLGSGGKLNIATTTMFNHGLIFSGDDMTLRLTNFTNQYGDVYSLGKFDLAADDQSHAAAVLENISGTLESSGDMTLRTASLINRKNVFRLGQQQISGNIVMDCTNLDCSGDHWNVDFVATERFQSTLEQDSSAAQINSGGNLTIRGGDIANHYSSISATGDIDITGNNLENLGAASELIDRVLRVNTGRTNDGDVARLVNNYVTPYNNQPLPKVLPGAITGLPTVSLIETHTPTGLLAPAVIQAGGKVSISATQSLTNSSVLAYQAPQIAGGQTENTAVGDNGFAQLVQLNPQLPPDLQQQQVNPLALPGFSLPVGSDGLFRLSDQSTVAAAASSAITENSQFPQVSGAEGLPSGVKKADAHHYLIETNPLLTNLKQFLSSSYLLDQLGYSPDHTQLLLGDGLYEQRLMREAIVARTGQRFIDGLTSDEAMFKYLMDNAIASQEELHLSVGVSLSAAQVSALTHDIVWMEEQEVMGHKVLVPVLYLAQANDRLAPSGALIQGHDVALISGSELKNSGTLRATENLSATANNINNSGLMQAGSRLDLLATDSIRNAQGGIINGRDVSAIALTGDINNERSVTQESRTGKGFSSHTSVVDSAAGIEASNDLRLSAGRDLLNVGGTLKAGGDADLSASRDVVITSAQEEQSRTTQDKRHTWSDNSITQHGSEIQVGDDLSIDAGRDLAVVGSTVKAGGDVALSASNDVTIASAADETSREYRYKGDGKKVTQEDSSVRNQASVIGAGGNLDIDAGNDLSLIGSQLKAGDEAYLYAGDDLNVLTAQDSTSHEYDYSKKGDWGSKKTQNDQVNDVKNIGSSITTGGDLTLVSEGDQRYQNAHLESGNDLTLDSAGAITFEAVKDSHQESHEKSNSDLAWTSSKGKGSTDETVRQSELTAQGQITIKAVDGLKIDYKHLDQKSVSQAIDAMVKADPNLAWIKDAEARGDVDWRAVQEVHDAYSYHNESLGAAPSLAIAIVAAAYLGPVYGPMASNLAVGTINNGGDLGRGLQYASSSDNLKNYAIAAATAYLATKYFDNVLQTKTDVVTGKITVDLSSVSGASRFAANQAMQNLTSTALSKALGQGGSFSDALKDSLYNTFAAAGFNSIGDFGVAHGLDAGDSQMVLMHALMGGLAAQARGDSFAAGAIGAGLNEALVSDLDKLVSGYSPENREAMLTMASQLTGLIGVAVSDPGASYDELDTGAWAAKNSTQYNYLNHAENQERWEAKKACDSGDSNACGRVAELDALDKNRDLALYSACSEGGSGELCGQLRADAWAAAESLKVAGWSPEAQQQYAEAMRNPELMAYTIESELRSINAVNDPVTAAEMKGLAESMADFASDFLPGYGDAKAFAEAEDPFDYLIAGVGILPGAGDTAQKVLKEAKELYLSGKAAEAAKLIDGLNSSIKATGEAVSIGGKTCVYSCVVDGVTRYVGITDDIVKRGQTHLREKGIVITKIRGFEGLSRVDARAVEQTLIDFYGLGKDGGTLINKINSISKIKNPTKYEQGLIRGAELLKKAGYEGF